MAVFTSRDINTVTDSLNRWESRSELTDSSRATLFVILNNKQRSDNIYLIYVIET